MRRHLVGVASFAIVGALFGAGPASADQAPAGCTTNGLAINITKSRTLVRNGDTVDYTVSVSNDAPGSCNITGATVRLTLPARDGTENGQVVTLATNQDFPANTHVTAYPAVHYTVDVNPGVNDAKVLATADGTLHDAPNNHNFYVEKRLGLDIPPPTMALTKAASVLTGPAALTVTYTYTVVNTSPVDLPIANVAVTDDLCSPLAFASGDTNGNAKLDVTETWTYTCTTTHANPGVYTNTANTTGVGPRGEPVKAGPAQQTVTVTPQIFPIPPVTAPEAKAPAACVSTPKTLSVRAKELTTVRVHITDATGNASGASVRVTGPGLVRRAKTDASGMVTFKVRPTKSGKLVIQADRCFGADRLSVKSARKTVSRRVPRVTG